MCYKIELFYLLLTTIKYGLALKPHFLLSLHAAGSSMAAVTVQPQAASVASRFFNATLHRRMTSTYLDIHTNKGGIHGQLQIVYRWTVC